MNGWVGSWVGRNGPGSAGQVPDGWEIKSKGLRKQRELTKKISLNWHKVSLTSARKSAKQSAEGSASSKQAFILVDLELKHQHALYKRSTM